MSQTTDFLRHLPLGINPSWSAEGASTSHQKKAGAARTFTTTAAIFGPFAPGDYEITIFDNAALPAGTPDNIVYRYERFTETTSTLDADDDHAWPASKVSVLPASFTEEYNKISLAAITGSVKTMAISIRQVRCR